MTKRYLWIVVVILLIVGLALAGYLQRTYRSGAKGENADSQPSIPCDQLEVHLISVSTDFDVMLHVLNGLCDCPDPLSDRGKGILLHQFVTSLARWSLSQALMLPAVEAAVQCRAEELFPYWLDRLERADVEDMSLHLLHADPVFDVFLNSDDLDISAHLETLERLRGHPNVLVADAVEGFMAQMESRTAP